MALGGRCLANKHHNQPKVGGGGKRGVGDETRPGRNVWDGHFTVVWGGEWSDIKKETGTGQRR